MDEKKEETAPENKEETTPETKPTPTEEDGTEEEQAIVKKANDAAQTAKEAEELKAANLAKEEKLIERKEALAKLGGGSPAGDKPSKPEETPSEYKDRVMRNEI